jgi:hypothetical protein
MTGSTVPSSQLAQGQRKIGIFADAGFNSVVAHGDTTGETDLRLAQHPTDIVPDLIKLLFLDVVGIDLEEQIGAALQVEAKHQMTLRPQRPGLDACFREEVRHGAQTYHQRRQDDRQRLPPREIKH